MEEKRRNRSSNDVCGWEKEDDVQKPNCIF